jgi:hypothetical protein
VHATVYGTVKHGVQQVGASVIGVLVAFGAGLLLGVDALSVGAVVLVGLLANLVVWPPLRDRGAAHQIGIIDDRIGDLLCDIAATLRAGREPAVDEWIARSNDLHEDIDESWQVLGQARESGRLNPRRVKVPRPPALSAR